MLQKHHQHPQDGCPYVTGSDTVGIFVAVSPKEIKFRTGKYVVSRFELCVSGITSRSKQKRIGSKRVPAVFPGCGKMTEVAIHPF